ncbi:Transcription repressor OFP17 [Glycine soja]
MEIRLIVSNCLYSSSKTSRSKDKDRLPDLKNPLYIEHETLPFPSYNSPLAPAYARACCVDKREASLQVEETCKKIENYLVEMIVEEGKMRDLMDLEELLLCWKNLSVLSSLN